jgi:hypothetical protein
MPYFRVDDGLHSHPKALQAGNAALGLWTRCGSYCGRYNTGGRVPAEIAKSYGTKTEIARLVAAGLWRPVEGGYQMHDWTDHNYTVEQVDQQRANAAQRQREKRERDMSRRDSRSDTPRDSDTASRRESQPPDQTRPDQTTVSNRSNNSDDYYTVSESSSSVEEVIRITARAIAAEEQENGRIRSSFRGCEQGAAANVRAEQLPEIHALLARGFDAVWTAGLLRNDHVAARRAARALGITIPGEGQVTA